MTDPVITRQAHFAAPQPPQELERVRDRFYRVPGSGGSGAGLGLSIVDRIAAQHGARLQVETRENGTVFCATIGGLNPAA